MDSLSESIMECICDKICKYSGQCDIDEPDFRCYAEDELRNTVKEYFSED